MMHLLNSPSYWTPKLKIALLALATYLARAEEFSVFRKEDALIPLHLLKTER